jgi:hypothetical protein
MPTMLILILILQAVHTSPVSTSHSSYGTEIEVIVMAYGPRITKGWGNLAVNAPAYQMAVEELSKRYSNTTTIKFTYVYTTIRSCLAVTDNGDEYMASWYYRYQRPGRIFLFISPASEVGVGPILGLLKYLKYNLII